ncbi:MAG: hypothetical protein Q9200_001920 [Gallowayella weberi]
MADPFSTGASTAGLVSPGLTVFSGILKYYSAYKDQDSDVSTMCISLMALEKMFIVLNRKIDHPSLDPECASLVKSSINNCESGICGLRVKLDKIRHIKPDIITRLRRLQYPFQQKTLEKLSQTISDMRGNLNVATDTLQLDVSITSLDRLQQVDTNIAKLNEGQTQAVLRELQVEERNALTWLSPLEFYSKQNDSLSRHQAGTGRWLLDSTEFSSWVDGDQRVLWCPGMHVLLDSARFANAIGGSSMVIGHLEEKHKSQNVAIAYVYCVHNAEHQSASNFLGNLLGQLALQSPTFPEDIKSCHKQHSRNGTRPALSDLSRLLASQVQLFDKVFVLVDALDECPDHDGTRASFLSNVYELPASTKLMVTSRDLPSIASLFKDDLRLDIRAREEDVKLFIESQMEQRRELNDLLENRDDIRSIIAKTIVDLSNGMFLIAVLHIDSLAKEDNIRDLKESLHRLPKDLDRTYDDAMKRIKGQNSRKLTALSIRPGDTFLDPEAIPKAESFVSTCCGLVVVEDESTIVRLVHYTTEEYFKRELQCYRDQAAHQATFLGIPFFVKKLLDQGAEIDAQDSYGWTPLHMACIEGHIEVVQLLLDFGAAFNLCTKFKESALCLAVSSDRNTIARLLLSQGAEVNTRDRNRQTLLHKACLEEHIEVCQSLLDFNADVNLRDYCGWNTLHYAAQSGIPAIARLLLSRGVEVNARATDGKTPLHVACWRGNIEVVQSLLDFNADINLNDYSGTSTRSNAGTTPLHLVSSQGYIEIVQLLLDFHADVNLRNKNGRNALYDAVQHNRPEAAQLLLENGANLTKEEIGELIKDKEQTQAILDLLIKCHDKCLGVLRSSRLERPMDWEDLKRSCAEHAQQESGSEVSSSEA